jgi:predicted RNase H-related nuclease YkuK (DUF458 family)
MLNESKIQRANQTVISYAELEKELLSNISSASKIAVGSDSQILPHHISFVTTICIHDPGHGGKFFFIKKKENKNLFHNMRNRIMNEVMLSLDIANDIQSITNRKVEVHIDVGEDELKSKTSKFSKEFLGIVNSFGFEGKIKPDSWASYVADRFTKS